MHSEKPRMSPAEEHWLYHPGPSAGGAFLHVQPWRALVSLGVAQSSSGGRLGAGRTGSCTKGAGTVGAPAGCPSPPSMSHVGRRDRPRGYAPRLAANKRVGAWPVGEV